MMNHVPQTGSRDDFFGKLLEPPSGGAMGVISNCKRSYPGEDWQDGLILTKPLTVVAIALANRMALAVWTHAESRRSQAGRMTE
jgi:hypothetical protein